ncbi:PREDICTED: neurofilament heavy polypeptide-like, partial [Apaloderma vittatum]|uniref:neurofilament heavy polypeptide-like n=1 Tax=Apaloderma vittatum TaxID=57397 RepID=UPI0005217B7A
PFNMHRVENLPDLSFPTDMKNVPLFMDHADASRDIHAPHGPMMVPEQPFLGPLYSAAETLDPSAFIGLDSAAEFLQDRAVPEEPWMGAQHDVKGPDASFFVEPPVPPTVSEAIKHLTLDAACVAALDVLPVSAEKADSVLAGDAKPAQALDAPFAPAAETSPFQAVDVGFAPPPEAKAPPLEAKAPPPEAKFPPAADAGSHNAMDLAFAPAADTKSAHTVDSELAPAADLKSHHALDSEFGPGADTKSHHTMDSGFSPAAVAEFAPAGEVNHHHAMDSAFSPVADAKPLPAVDSVPAEAKPVSAADTEVAAAQELKTPEPAAEPEKSPLKFPAEATANVEHEPKVPEVCVDVSERAKDSKTPPSPHDEHLPEQTNHLSEPAAPVEAKEAVALENKDLLPEKSVTAGAVTVTEQEKEEAERNHVQHAEPQQEKTLQEPTGLPTAQIRQANKSSERRFGRAKPAPVPIADVPEERLVGLPQPKSTDPKADPCPVAEPGCAAGTSPRTRVSHQKAAERPSVAESCGDLPGERWDLEGSAAIVKKKKKKPKQKRNQLPRTTEFWDENVAASKAPRNPPLAAELRKPDGCPLVPAEARGEQPVASGGRAAGTPRDVRRVAGSHVPDEQNASSVPAQQAQKPHVPLESVSAAKTGDVVKAEQRDDGLMSQSKGKRTEVPLEQVGETKKGESVTAKGPTKPTERDFLDKNEKREYKESKCADPTAPLSEAIDVSKVETPLQPKPPESLPSDQGKEAQRSSPRRSALSDAVRRELQAARGALEAAGKQRGRREKSKEVENGSFGQPRVEDKLPHEPKAAAETKPASSDKCLAVDFSTSGGASKTPADTTKIPVAPLVSPKPEEVSALQNGKAAVLSELPLHLSAKPAASERPPAAEAGDGTVAADSPEKNKGKGFVAFEQQPGKDLGITHGLDRPKKKRGEGKAKKIKSFSEQMMPLEDVGKLSDGRPGGDPYRWCKRVVALAESHCVPLAGGEPGISVAGALSIALVLQGLV